MITVNPTNLPLIDYRKLQPFQDNLKDLDEANYAKLLASLNKYGFFVPAYVWFDQGIPYIIDSHQRHRVLMHEEIQFENSGFEIPYIEIAAANAKEAKEKVLLVSSQYGTITPDGLDEFAALAELEVDELDVNFDAINLEKLWAEMNPPSKSDDLEAPEPTEKSKTLKYTAEDIKTRYTSWCEAKGRTDDGFADSL